MIVGQDFLDLAKKWVAEPTEAEWRCAVSRAYYAAFHEAKQLLSDLGFQVPRGDRAHAYLWRRLCNCSEARVQIAGSDLNSLRGDRNKADYELEHTLVHRQALLQVACAERIMQSLRAATQEPAQSKIREAMKVYERDVLKDVSWRP